MVGETWTVEKGGPPMLNGKPIRVSARDKLDESILFVGCGKDDDALQHRHRALPRASLRARKMRMMGSAALGMAYIACGRLDAYIESRISLWDIAAGKLLVEAAGGKVDLTPASTEQPGSLVHRRHQRQNPDRGNPLTSATTSGLDQPRTPQYDP